VQLVVAVLQKFPSLLKRSLSAIPINWASVESTALYVGGITYIIYLLDHAEIDPEIANSLHLRLVTSSADESLDIEDCFMSFLPSGMLMRRQHMIVAIIS
jgi:hypothetical protein